MGDLTNLSGFKEIDVVLSLMVWTEAANKMKDPIDTPIHNRTDETKNECTEQVGAYLLGAHIHHATQARNLEVWYQNLPGNDESKWNEEINR